MAATDDGWDPLADTKLVLLDAATAEVSSYFRRLELAQTTSGCLLGVGIGIRFIETAYNRFELCLGLHGALIQTNGASHSLLSLYSHRNAWANWHPLGRPVTCLAQGARQIEHVYL
jgi:hypothetical protein